MNRYIDEKGVSLIEVIVSIAILGILIVSIFDLLKINSKLNIKSKDQIIATNLAEGKIEELKFSKVIKLGENNVYENDFTIDTFVEETDNLYKIVVEVKKNNKTIEKLLTYKSSLKGSGLY